MTEFSNFSAGRADTPRKHVSKEAFAGQMFRFESIAEMEQNHG
jgi:hypothetical protein